MLANRYMPDDDVCPVGEELLGELYSASKRGLPSLAASIPPRVRATLALYCYRRSHLHAMGLAIAATCEEDDLVREGGRVGANLFARSREAHAAQRLAALEPNKRKVTLASGQLRVMPPLDDAPDDDSE
ncbi:MAG TPA: hypothetical protein VKW08_15275 [Xanthobacteraceae bacterium]|nr:hypothetical protein [Xanthobacteraceae bacterium]